MVRAKKEMFQLDQNIQNRLPIYFLLEADRIPYQFLRMKSQ
ncbi:hypothetical protein SAMN04488556_0050 [Halostagnicola kamekurae]|uniref:Uncharacterized protein n=1 Tax=Halostagnicola kamekurae TaxID=619731 RepID=A0A1I6V496_9EURY|nr:hypothetical protein SAMN04488556_0050 [Halostagnicola kamekurae]